MIGGGGEIWNPTSQLFENSIRRVFSTFFVMPFINLYFIMICESMLSRELGWIIISIINCPMAQFLK
jgi:hypothetical protein